MRKVLVVLGLILAFNGLWIHSYTKLDREAMQSANLLHKLPNPMVYQLTTNAKGELLVQCLNGADATIFVPERFGSMVVSCGTEKQDNYYSPANY